MSPRIRHCVECPRCHTRYLIGFSPYGNGSYLLSDRNEHSGEYTLYCSCGRPPNISRWTSSGLKNYVVSNRAHDRGYGSPKEIMPVGNMRKVSS